jgi:hypothetical protein
MDINRNAKPEPKRNPEKNPISSRSNVPSVRSDRKWITIPDAIKRSDTNMLYLLLI